MHGMEHPLMKQGAAEKCHLESYNVFGLPLPGQIDAAKLPLA